jgi:hypothetical protein
MLAPKARLVSEVYPVEEFVVKITRPHGDPPAFWVEDADGELKMAFPFDGEQGKVFTELIGQEGTTYHKACVTTDGEFGIERQELQGYDW